VVAEKRDWWDYTRRRERLNRDLPATAPIA
jgi:hypothetical protein